MALTDNLVELWKLNEASGNAVGSFGGNTLTDNNTVTSDTGKVYALARDFESGNTEYLSVADNAALSLGGDISFEFCVWIKQESTAGGFPMIFAKDDVGSSREFALYHNSGASALRVEVGTNGSTMNGVNGPNISTGVWYMVLVGRNAATDEIFISLNNGTKFTTANTTTFNGTTAFQIGGRNGANTWDGLIGPVIFWKGRILTTQEESDLYNGGNGLAISLFNPSWARSSNSVLGVS